MKPVLKTLKMVDVAVILKDGGPVFRGNGYDGYYPIVEQFSILPTSRITFRNEENYSKNIETHDRQNTNKTLRFGDGRNNNKIDVTDGDIIIGGQTLILNFTKFSVTVFDKNNIETLIQPINAGELNDKYGGKIIVIQLNILPTPSNQSKITKREGENYLVDSLNYHNFNPNTANDLPINTVTDSLKVRHFAKEAWTYFIKNDSDTRVNSLKVVTMGVIDYRIFDNDATHKEENVLFTNIGLLFSKQSDCSSLYNPSADNIFDLSELKKLVLPGTPFIYIVDNFNEVSDRWYWFAGEAYKVPKVKDHPRDKNGLYVCVFTENCGIRHLSFCELGDIDKLTFISKDQETAKLGADRTKIREQMIEEQRTELQLTELDKKRENLEKEHQLKQIISDLQAQNEELKLKQTQFKADIERESLFDKTRYERYGNDMKQHFDERKYARDDVRYERDSTLEVFKTIAAVAGVAATGFVIMKQLGKVS